MEPDKPLEGMTQDMLWPPTGGIKFKYGVAISTTPNDLLTLKNNLEIILNKINDNVNQELHEIKTTANLIIIIYKEYENVHH